MKEISGEDVDALMAGHEGRPPAEIERDLAIASLTRLRLLTAGPSASVFRAYQTATQRTVAVKVLHDELTSEVGQRFDRERAITGQLTGHTSVVPLLHTGTTADGEPYLVLPYYRRGSLADLMNRYGPLPWREATFLMKPVASTIAEVHLWGLVHRNLKPTNILLTDFLRPRVADFGMCLPSGQESTSATLVHGAFAPDEAATTGQTDPNMDVYGLAAILRSLLAGGSLAPIDDDTPARILELIERSMSRDPAERPETVAAFIAELSHGDESAASSTSTGTVPMVSAVPQDGRSGRRLSKADGFTGSVDDDADRDTLGEPGSAPDDSDSSATTTESDASDRVVTATSDRKELHPARSGSPDVYYLLGLVALIITGIIAMVASAILAFQ